MKLYSRNAAALLFEKASLLEKQPHNSWRCIYLSLSDRQERHNHMLRAQFVVKAIAERLEHIDGSVYLCGDGDVFILFQGPLKPVVSRLANHFEDLQEGSEIFTILDLSKDWRLFYLLCKSKSLKKHSVWEELRVMAHYQAALRPEGALQ